jgi:hypothetical protein
VHTVWLPEARHAAAEIKEGPDVQVLSNDVSVEIAPRHQSEEVTPNQVHFAVPVQNRPQAGSQDFVGLGSDGSAGGRHVLCSIASDYRISPRRASA